MSKLEEKYRKKLELAAKQGVEVVPAEPRGVAKTRVLEVLTAMGLATQDMVDGVFALLDDQTPSEFRNAPEGATFGDGARTNHLACHIGVLQRGGTELDREGRDYWIKPLREIGAIEPIYLDPKSRQFVPGHPVPKSPNLAYRLSAEFVEVLRSSATDLSRRVDQWMSSDARRQRQQRIADLTAQSRKQVKTSHIDLIEASIRQYASVFLPGFEVLYTDAEDGERITAEESARLARYGVSLGLDSAMPDVLLGHPDKKLLWVIEAVTSDGEVDWQKVQSIWAIAQNASIEGLGFTTAYPDWKSAARRQARLRNVFVGTYIWVMDDPARHFLVEEESVSDKRRVAGIFTRAQFGGLN